MTEIAENALSATESQWRALVEKALKGLSFDSLTSTTSDDLSLQPLYRASSSDPLRSKAAPWCLFQRLDQSDPAAANAQALDDLMNGAGGLELVFKTSPWAWFDGLDFSREALKRSLDGIDLSLISVRLEAGAHAERALDLLQSLAEEQGLDADALQITGGHDVAGLISYGLWPDSKRSYLPAFDGRFWNAAGASPAQELALVLASLVAALGRSNSGKEDSGTDGPLPVTSNAVTLVAEADQFATIAKFRAWRLLLSRLMEVLGAGDIVGDAPVAPSTLSTLSALTLHGETAWRELSAIDPHVNILRATTAALSAGVAGVDSLTVLPFTAASEIADPAARRLARNTQSILMEEASLALVADPAAGSGGLDAITDDLAAKAWGLFQDIESAGGLSAAIARGLPQGWITAAAQVRQSQLASGQSVLVGSSIFADLEVVGSRDTVDAPCFTLPENASLRPTRLSAPFETAPQSRKER